MSKLKLLSIVLIFAFIHTACSDSGSNTTPDPEPIEPTLTVSGPMQGDLVEGEVTLSISGEAEQGFSEARLFVGDQQIETISDPSLPIEDTIATYNYNNGDYELRAEVDVAGMDTTITDGISVTLENYFFELEMSNYISSYRESDTNVFLFIADPEGNVLREVDLTARGDRTLQLLPPQAFEDDIPNSFSMTFGYQSIQRGEEVFELYSDAGLTPWSNFQINLEESEPTTASLGVEFTNQPPNHQSYDPVYVGQDATGGGILINNPGSFSFPSDAEEALLIKYLPGTNGEEMENPIPPLYYLEEHLQDSLGTTDSLRYDISNDFNPMDIHHIGVPSGYRSSYVTTHIESRVPFKDGSYFLWSYGYPYGVETPSDEVIAAVPDIEGKKLGFATSLSSTNSSKRIYIQKGGLDALPQQFELPADQNFVTVNNSSLDDIKLEAPNTNSSVDFTELTAHHVVPNSNGFNIEKQRWAVTLPDTVSNFTFPSIGDSLSPSVSAYNRSKLQLIQAQSYDYHSYDGFDDYINQYYGETINSPFNYIRWSTSVGQGSSTKVRKKERSILDKGRRNHLIPTHSKNY